MSREGAALILKKDGGELVQLGLKHILAVNHGGQRVGNCQIANRLLGLTAELYFQELSKFDVLVNYSPEKRKNELRAERKIEAGPFTLKSGFELKNYSELLKVKYTDKFDENLTGAEKLEVEKILTEVHKKTKAIHEESKNLKSVEEMKQGLIDKFLIPKKRLIQAFKRILRRISRDYVQQIDPDFYASLSPETLDLLKVERGYKFPKHREAFLQLTNFL